MNNKENKDKIYIIPEYKSVEVENIDYDDYKYLETKFSFNKDINKPEIKKIPTRKEGIYKTIIRNTSYAGVIQLKNVRLHLSTKVNAKLFFILNFLRPENEKDEKGSSFIFDSDKLIDMEKGTNFYDPMGRLFANQLENIIKKVGLHREIVRKHENRDFTKGRLDVKKQMDNELHNRFKFACVFNEFTYNNKPNQIILKATNSIIPRIKYNENLIKDLRFYEYSMLEHIELTNISAEDCDNVIFNELNDYYKDIIKFSKVILNESYIKSYLIGESIGFNFLINMNKACQDLFEAMVRNTVNKYFPDLEIVPQELINSIIIGGSERPDLVIRDRKTKAIILVFEFKYKLEDTSSDHRQATMYGLATPGRRRVCVLYPKSKKDIEPTICFRPDITKLEGKGTIYNRAIDLCMDENLDFDEYVKSMENQIMNIITDILY